MNSTSPTHRITVCLDINRAIIGAYRAMQVFMACRALAQHLEPDCAIRAIYEDYERVGWAFTLSDPENVERLRQHHTLAMARC